MKRKYRSGSAWAFWRWTELDSGQLERLHIIKMPWFAICLHWLNTPDPEPWEHDHPVAFLSLIVRGSYTETRDGKTYRRRWFNFLRSTDRHRIIEAGAVTLCLMGPKVRDWGYHTPEGWRHWKAYYAGKAA